MHINSEQAGDEIMIKKAENCYSFRWKEIFARSHDDDKNITWEHKKMGGKKKTVEVLRTELQLLNQLCHMEGLWNP